MGRKRGSEEERERQRRRRETGEKKEGKEREKKLDKAGSRIGWKIDKMFLE